MPVLHVRNTKIWALDKGPVEEGEDTVVEVWSSGSRCQKPYRSTNGT